MSWKPRALRIQDVMILIAAIAVAVVWSRETSRYSALMRMVADSRYVPPFQLLEIVPSLACSSLAVLVIRATSSHQSVLRLVREPGFVVGLAVVLLGIVSLIYALFVVKQWPPSPSHPVSF